MRLRWITAAHIDACSYHVKQVLVQKYIMNLLKTYHYQNQSTASPPVLL